MERLSVIFFLPFVMMISACSAGSGSREEIGNAKTTQEGTQVVEGMVRFIGVEGGCWQLQADNGKTYELVGELAGTLRTDGVHVRLEVRKKKALASFCMVGELIEVLKILEIKD